MNGIKRLINFDKNIINNDKLINIIFNFVMKNNIYNLIYFSDIIYFLQIINIDKIYDSKLKIILKITYEYKNGMNILDILNKYIKNLDEIKIFIKEYKINCSWLMYRQLNEFYSVYREYTDIYLKYNNTEIYYSTFIDNDLNLYLKI